MKNLPEELKYTDTHEWCRKEADGVYTIGITAYAQKMLGDLVYVELPSLNQAVSKKGEFATVESVKSASEVYAPISGEVVRLNESLEESPQLINEQPYEQGWLVTIKATVAEEFDTLLNAKQYAELIAQVD